MQQVAHWSLVWRAWSRWLMKRWNMPSKLVWEQCWTQWSLSRYYSAAGEWRTVIGRSRNARERMGWARKRKPRRHRDTEKNRLITNFTNGRISRIIRVICWFVSFVIFPSSLCPRVSVLWFLDKEQTRLEWMTFSQRNEEAYCACSVAWSVMLLGGAGDMISVILSSPSSALLPAPTKPNISVMIEQPLRPSKISRGNHMFVTSFVFQWRDHWLRYRPNSLWLYHGGCDILASLLIALPF